MMFYVDICYSVGNVARMEVLCTDRLITPKVQ